MEFTESFLHSTAKDYDTTVENVRHIANMSDSIDDFYDRMERTVIENH